MPRSSLAGILEALGMLSSRYNNFTSSFQHLLASECSVLVRTSGIFRVKEKLPVKKIFFSSVTISISFQSSSSNIYLNLTTLECRKYTIELTARGFQVVSDSDHDTTNLEEVERAEEEEGEFFETPYSLLNKISPGFSNAFGQDLFKKLKIVQEERKE